MVDNAKLAGTKVTRECALCGLITEEAIVVCPEDGSALITHKPDPLIGTILGGKFEVLSLLGSGGMGNVYKAVQKPVGRYVALKVLHSEKLTKNQSVLRFQQEAKAAAALSHPNVVGFFDYGLTEDNIPYIVMDFVEGMPLDQALREQGTLPVDRFIRLFTEACDALDHAHQKGVIHRDIKPSNLMLTNRSDGTETVKILDFGIAKLMPSASEGAEKVSLTQTGEVFGSPQYMSPEQCNGGEMDARSDIYSLGCVMYEALAGRPPVRGDNIVQTVYKHTHEKPPSLKTVRPDLDIPEQLEVLVLKALEKEPAMRFPSMSVLKRNLEFVPTFAEKEKTLGPAPQAPDMVPMRTSWLRWALPVVAGVLLLGGGVAWFVYANDLKAQVAWIEFSEGAHSERLLKPTRQLRDLFAKDGNNNDAFRYAAKAIELSKATEPNSLNAANDVLAGADILAAQKDDRANEYLRRAREIFRALLREGRHREDWQQNTAIDKTLMTIDQRLDDAESDDGLADLLGQAEDMRAAGSIEQSVPLYDKLFEKRAKLNREKLGTLYSAVFALAEELAVKGNPDNAEAQYKNAIAIGTDSYGAGNERVLTAKRQLGLFYEAHNRYTAAESLLQDTLAQANESLGPTNDLSIQLLDDLAHVYDNMKELKTAAEMRKLAESLKTQRQ